jgi:hypothetical protein
MRKSAQFKFKLLLLTASALVLAACRLTPSAADPSPPHPSVSGTTPVVTAGGYVVKTDYTGLTPYRLPEEKYTRLSDGPLPALVPADKYGTLLPYLGKPVYYSYGISMTGLYGLVTADGMIVTDPVYTEVRQGFYYDYGSNTMTHVPAYRLQQLPGQFDKESPWKSVRCAACAKDGSWITPFDYTDIFFAEAVILLVRDYDNNDVDVMDYDGRLLYNTKTLNCYELLPPQSAYMFERFYGDGLIALTLKNGKTVYVEAKTGAEHTTDYELSGAFSEGLCAVKSGGLFGFIDKTFSLVIPPQYTMADMFDNGRCIVQREDGSYAVIDRAGTPLLTGSTHISRSVRGVFDVFDGDRRTCYYGDDLKAVKGGEHQIEPLSDSWFCYKTVTGIVVFNPETGESTTLEGVSGIGYIRGGLVNVYYIDGEHWREGIVTLDGREVISPAENQSAAVAISEVSGKTYIIVTKYSAAPDFKVFDGGGSILFEGTGYAAFLPQQDLFEIRSNSSYSYVDPTGDTVFRFSLLEYVPD